MEKTVIRQTRDCKTRGEHIELKLMLKAASENFVVAKPYGDSMPYDFILDSGKRRVRVQVKSVFVGRKGMYHVRTAHGYNRPYTASEIDALVAYIVPEDAWYVIPVEVLLGKAMIAVFPHIFRSKSKFEQYREAWHLLR